MSKIVQAILKFFGRSESKLLGIFKSDIFGEPKNMKNLAVFDFDHTVIDDNSDTAVMKLVDNSKISRELKALHKEEGWTAFMQGVFEILHQNKVTEPDIHNLVKHLPAVPGLCSLINELHDNMNYDIIIISDANTYFIESWLEANNMTSKVYKIYSNPAFFNEEGLLIVKMYHIQESCKLSTKNLCKGIIMEEFINEQATNGLHYERVIVVGDGAHDFCPMLKLDKKGVACIRDKYKCLELLKKSKEGKSFDENGTKYQLDAQVCIWENGDQILNFLKRLD